MGGQVSHLNVLLVQQVGNASHDVFFTRLLDCVCVCVRARGIKKQQNR